jgi:hypothetical protein
VRPNGYGEWVDADVVVPVFVEYDAGTEHLSTLTDKLAGCLAHPGRDTVGELGLARSHAVHRLSSVARDQILLNRSADN